MKKVIISLVIAMVALVSNIVSASFLGIPDMEYKLGSWDKVDPKMVFTHKVVNPSQKVYFQLREYRIFNVPGKGYFTTASDSTFRNEFVFRPRTINEIAQLAKDLKFKFTVPLKEVPYWYDYRERRETSSRFKFCPDGPNFAVVGGSFRDLIVEGTHFEIVSGDDWDGRYTKAEYNYDNIGTLEKTTYVVEWSERVAQRYGLWKYDQENDRYISRYKADFGTADMYMPLPYEEKEGEWIFGVIVNGVLFETGGPGLYGESLRGFLNNPVSSLVIIVQKVQLDVKRSEDDEESSRQWNQMWAERRKIAQRYIDEVFSKD